MTYLTFEEYVKIGGSLDKTAFNRNIDRACGTIDRATFGRVQQMKEVPERVKTCCRDLTEYFATKIATGERQASYVWKTAGNVTQAAQYPKSSPEELTFAVEELLLDHLYMVTDDFGTPLLYKGAKK